MGGACMSRSTLFCPKKKVPESILVLYSPFYSITVRTYKVSLYFSIYSIEICLP